MMFALASRKTLIIYLIWTGAGSTRAKTKSEIHPQSFNLELENAGVHKYQVLFSLFQGFIFSFHIEPQGCIFQFGGPCAHNKEADRVEDEEIPEWVPQSWCFCRERAELKSGIRGLSVYICIYNKYAYFIMFTELQVSWSHEVMWFSSLKLGTHRLSITVSEIVRRCRQNGWVLWWATAMCPMFMETFDWREQGVYSKWCVIYVIYVSWKWILFGGHWELKVQWNRYYHMCHWLGLVRMIETMDSEGIIGPYIDILQDLFDPTIDLSTGPVVANEKNTIFVRKGMR